MIATKSFSREKTRVKIVDSLENLRADLIDLMLQVEQAHANVKEPGFTALHDLFDKVWEDSAEYADRICRRISELGAVPQETSDWMRQKNSLSQSSARIVGGQEQVSALASRLSSLGRQIRISRISAGAAQDEETAGLFKTISQGLEKYLWLAEAARPSR
jgi:starvation-inducible DNA-binding protein